MTSSTEQEMYFFITDISGYTSYMIKNQMDYTHGTLIISDLMESLVKEVKLPMEISKLEGDAVFLFLREDKLGDEFKDPSVLRESLLHFFSVFSSKLQALRNSTACDCGGCSNIEALTLKIITHYGKAAMVQIGSFSELSGVDVILVHRLLKNHVEGKRYLLMTQPVYQKLAFPKEMKVTQGQEEDKDLGIIPVYIYFPPVEEMAPKEDLSFIQKTKSHLKLAVGEKLLKLGVKKPGEFHNLPPVS